MQKTKPFHRRKVVVIFFACAAAVFLLGSRLAYLMIARSEYYAKLAQDLHEREREIKAARGRILDRNGTVLADNRTVCTVSVIHSQIEDPERVIEVLSEELSLDEETVRKRVEKVSSIERVGKNIDKEIGDRIRNYNLAGVKVDGIIRMAAWRLRCSGLREGITRGVSAGKSSTMKYWPGLPAKF